MGTLACGYVPDAPSEKDWLLGVSNGPAHLDAGVILPETHSNIGLVLEVLDQGDAQSCVANAWAQAGRMDLVRRGVKNPKLASRMHAWALARAQHGAGKFNSGTYIRTTFDVVRKWGWVPEAEYPYHPHAYAEPIPPHVYLRAFKLGQSVDFRYWRDTSTGDQALDMIRRAVHAGCPYLFGTDVTSTFADADFGPVGALYVKRPSDADVIAGGHAMVVVGYRPDAFLVLSSWGDAWGDQGYAWLSNEYMTWERTRDRMVLESIPNYVFKSEV